MPAFWALCQLKFKFSTLRKSSQKKKIPKLQLLRYSLLNPQSVTFQSDCSFSKDVCFEVRFLIHNKNTNNKENVNLIKKYQFTGYQKVRKIAALFTDLMSFLEYLAFNLLPGFTN